jgi:prevent-host-death family protein
VFPVETDLLRAQGRAAAAGRPSPPGHTRQGLDHATVILFGRPGGGKEELAFQEVDPWASLGLRVMVTTAIFMTMKAKDKVIAAGVFKAKCLALLDEVETRGRTFTVTKRGRPVARVVPLAVRRSSALRGTLLHEAEDVLAPLDVAWDALL